jgi:oligoendopeptidase F
LSPALEQSRITAATLEAMNEAIAQSRHLPQRYLALKARLMGLPRLGFQDLEAPLPLEESTRIPWDEACQRIIDAFAEHHPEMGDFARLALEEKWVDAAPGSGRSPGGFCTSSHLLGQSRIFMTYQGTMGDVQTLAHELGHAYHNYVMRDMRSWARTYPMTLAESASTYAEAVLSQAMLADPASSPAQRAVLLNSSLERAVAFLLNIPMRFDFEVAFYQARQRGPVSVADTKEMMLQAQRDNYGDTLDHAQMDPWFWASKMHFYMSYTSFYNYPYAFGYLFSMAVLMRAQQEGPAFFPRYKALLRDTGLSHAEEVARRHLGVSLEDPAFWLTPMAMIEEDLAQLEALAPTLFPDRC